MRTHKYTKLDEQLAGRSAVEDTDALVHTAQAVRQAFAPQSANLDDGLERARARLRTTVRSQRMRDLVDAQQPAPSRRWSLHLSRPTAARVGFAAAALFVGAWMVTGMGSPLEPARVAARSLGLSSSSSAKVEKRLQPTAIDPLASGNAKGEQRTDRTRFSVEVEDVSTAGTHAVRITRNATPIANSPVSLDVTTLGAGQLELNTQDGATGVPVVQAGDLVEVLDSNGDVILSATLVSK